LTKAALPQSPRLLRSAGVRFGVIYAALFSISAAALAAFLWWSTAGLMERQTAAEIETDSELLISTFLMGGPRGVAAAIKDRIAGNIDDDALYLLVDQDFNRIEGNLNGWPPHLPVDEDWDELKVDRAGVTALMQVHYFDLPGGFHILLGRDIAVRSQLGRLMDGVREVSNAIAHDLRTPITRARTRLEDAAIHATSEGELRVAVERALTDLDGIVAVFQALLRISEIEAGARRSAFAPVDLVQLLQDLTELYDAVAEERGMVLKTEIADSLPVFGDRDMIQQAVANLLDNAVKFSPEGGEITVRAGMVAGMVRIEVTDQGPGIPESDRPRATERFFRGEQARSTPGSGLGLALVQAVAQLHGGEVQLLDAGPGLRAVITLAAQVGDPPQTVRHAG
jgi:signal transduction histidine kinase